MKPKKAIKPKDTQFLSVIQPLYSSEQWMYHIAGLLLDGWKIEAVYASRKIKKPPLK